jgi:peptidoglycan hydrolase-like protein with peptidoglycan-binding domain
MSINLFALGNRATSITAVAVLVVAAVLLAAASPARAASPAPLLREGAGMGAKPSVQVRHVQRALDRRGYDLGAPGVDGRFGPLTAAAVRRLQARSGLSVDGVVGPRTRKALGLRRSAARHAPRASATRTPAAKRSRPRSLTPLSPAPAAPTVLTQPASDQFDLVLIGALLGILIGVLAAVLFGSTRRKRPGTEHAAGAVPAAPPPREPERPRESGVPAGAPVVGYVPMAGKLGSSEVADAVAAIEASCERSGWRMLEVVGDHENGRPAERPGLSYALERIARGEARALVVSDLQRMSRPIDDLGGLLTWFREAHATLIALDLGIDTSTPEGQHTVSALITLSRWRRERVAGADATERAAPGDRHRRASDRMRVA